MLTDAVPAGTVRRFGLRGWIPPVLLIALLTLPVSTFGVVQIATTARDQLQGPAAVTDFLAYYGGVQMLLRDPARLYDGATQRDLQRELQGGGVANVPFVSPPYVPLMQAPLGWLPFGLAYVVWGALSLASLVLAAYLLAPRASVRGAWVGWLIVAPLFVPLLFGLVMGQSSSLMLLGFCAFARLVDRHRLFGGLALLAWAWKPNMLPAYVAALAAARNWRALSALGAAMLMSFGAALVVIGPAGLQGFIQASATRFVVAAMRPDGHPEGITFLTIAQALLGVGLPATVAAVAAGIAVYAAVSAVWWRGLRSDARRHLQFAILPIAATLSSLHAGVYELTTWLASVWLLLEYGRAVPAARGRAVALVLAIWCAGNAAVVGQTSPLLPALAAIAVAVLGGVLWLYVVDSRQLSLRSASAPARAAARPPGRGTCRASAPRRDSRDPPPF